MTLQANNVFLALCISGWAWECVECSIVQPYQLCQACYDKGQAHHQHPPGHTLLRMLPPPPVLQPGAPRTVPVSDTHPAWYVQAAGVAWSWKRHTLVSGEYEGRVYQDEVDVLVGWWNEHRAVSVSLLVSSYIPFLARLLAAADDASTLRCLLFLSTATGDRTEVDGEFMEVIWLGSSVRTFGALLERDGDCYLCPAADCKAFLPVEQRDVPYRSWYPQFTDEEATFSSPLGSTCPPMELFSHWLSWVHSTMRGRRFDLVKVQQMAARYAEQLTAVARAAAMLQQVHQVSMALHQLDCDRESQGCRPPHWVDPLTARSLQASLTVLRSCAGPHVAVEDVDAQSAIAACDDLHEPMQTTGLRAWRLAGLSCPV